MRHEELLRYHAAKYPLMRPEDLVKLCYQASFGAGHMLKNPGAVLEWLKAEYNAAEPVGGELFEPLPGGYARLYLGAAKSGGILPELVLALFSATASVEPDNDALARFLELIELAKSLAESDVFSFSRAELEGYLAGYLKDGEIPPPVIHSEVYRQEYYPHYRIVDARFVPLFELCKDIYNLSRGEGKRVVAAFDGRCASGKTTAAELISRAFGAEVVHCDDFFLPPHLRTPERYAEPGGNIHYERFAEEVVARLHSCEPFEYGVYDCSWGKITRRAKVSGSPLVIVEGAYSTHPRFGRYYNIFAFFDISPEQQMARIVKREGEEGWKAFSERWIPLEEAYIAATDAMSRADIVVRT